MKGRQGSVLQRAAQLGAGILLERLHELGAQLEHLFLVQ